MPDFSDSSYAKILRQFYANPDSIDLMGRLANATDKINGSLSSEIAKIFEKAGVNGNDVSEELAIGYMFHAFRRFMESLDIEYSGERENIWHEITCPALNSKDLRFMHKVSDEITESNVPSVGRLTHIEDVMVTELTVKLQENLSEDDCADFWEKSYFEIAVGPTMKIQLRYPCKVMARNIRVFKIGKVIVRPFEAFSVRGSFSEALSIPISFKVGACVTLFQSKPNPFHFRPVKGNNVPAAINQFAGGLGSLDAIYELPQQVEDAILGDNIPTHLQEDED